MFILKYPLIVVSSVFPYMLGIVERGGWQNTLAFAAVRLKHRGRVVSLPVRERPCVCT